MGMKPSWHYKRQAEEMERRETYFRTKAPPVEGTQVNQRDTVDRYYRSLFVKEGTDHRLFKVGVDQDALTKIGGNDIAGILAEPPANTVPLNIRNSGVLPTRAEWYSGRATPVTRTTKWNTKWTQSYDSTGTGAAARSHYSVPMSISTGGFEASTLLIKFRTIFNPAGMPNTALLGTKNGKCNLRLEYVPFSISN